MNCSSCAIFFFSFRPQNCGIDVLSSSRARRDTIHSKIHFFAVDGFFFSHLCKELVHFTLMYCNFCNFHTLLQQCFNDNCPLLAMSKKASLKMDAAFAMGLGVFYFMMPSWFMFLIQYKQGFLHNVCPLHGNNVIPIHEDSKTFAVKLKDAFQFCVEWDQLVPKIQIIRNTFMRDLSTHEQR